MYIAGAEVEGYYHQQSKKDLMKENYVRKAELNDALELAPKMRMGDRQEIMASNGATPLESFSYPFYSKRCKDLFYYRHKVRRCNWYVWVITH